jgi:hypothetical protein
LGSSFFGSPAFGGGAGEEVGGGEPGMAGGVPGMGWVCVPGGSGGVPGTAGFVAAACEGFGSGSLPAGSFAGAWG